MTSGPNGRWPVDYGAGRIANLSDHAARHGWKRILMLTGRASFSASGADASLGPLRAVADVEIWNDFAPNTDAGDLIRGLRLLAEHQFDAIIGVGGGSVMDMAKLLIAFAGVDDEDELERAIRGGEVGPRPGHLLLAPTTSGSGSEATHFAVVYIGNEKFSIASDSLRADAIVLDPLIAASGSPHQRATSGIDAVCQATESLWAVGGDDTSRRHARWALAYLLPAIRPFVASGHDADAAAMCIGSHLAGRAIDTSKTTAAHALSYGITKRYGIDHGNAVAVSLSGFVDAHASATDDHLQPSVDPLRHRAALATIGDRLGADATTSAGDRLRDLVADIGLTNRLRHMGVERADLPELVASVNVERLGNNPVRYSADQLAEILGTCW